MSPSLPPPSAAGFYSNLDVANGAKPTIELGETVDFTHGRMRSIGWKQDGEDQQPLMFQTLRPVFLTSGVIQGASAASIFKDSVPINVKQPDFCNKVKAAIKYTERSIRKLLAEPNTLQRVFSGDEASTGTAFIAIHPRYECEAFEVNTATSIVEEKQLKQFKGVQGRYLLLFQLHSIYAPANDNSWRLSFALRSISRVVDASEQPVGWSFGNVVPNSVHPRATKRHASAGSKEEDQASTVGKKRKVTPGKPTGDEGSSTGSRLVRKQQALVGKVASKDISRCTQEVSDAETVDLASDDSD